MRVTSLELLEKASVQDLEETLCAIDGVGSKMKRLCLSKFKEKILEEFRQEVRDTWNEATNSYSELEAFKIYRRMTERLGYNRTKNNPKLF